MKQLGAIVPIATPCTRAGALDLDGALAVCDDQLAGGCDGLFLFGSTGRGPWFGREDRARLCRAVADHVGPEVPLFAGCLADGLPAMLAHARAAKEGGAHAAVVTAPGYFRYSDAEVEAILRAFADASPLPVLLYDIPPFVHTTLAFDAILRLVAHDNVIGLKDSSGDEARFRRLLDALRDRADRYLLLGREQALAPALLAGASGFISTFALFDPRPFAALTRAARAGDAARAEAVQARITAVYERVVACMARRPETSTLFHLVNETLRRRGVCDNVLLAHEGECPGWLAEGAEELLAICAEAVDPAPLGAPSSRR
jgi:4-hydroxy-tetrahydrodipicolinate synthase